jgi:Family of unknown function (DUF6338)
VLPNSTTAILAFLGLVAPGLVFQLYRETYLPRSERTPFREVSYVVLVSLVCSAAAVGILVALAQGWPSAFPNVHDWITGRDYVADNWGLLARTGVSEVLLASLLAILAARVLDRKRNKRRLSDQSSWWTVFREIERDGENYLCVRLRNGAQYFGSLMDYTASPEVLAEREIALCHPGLCYRERPDQDETELDREVCVIVHGAEIESLTVSHVEKQQELSDT